MTHTATQPVLPGPALLLAKSQFLMPPRRTRAKNATTHPAEKQVDDDCLKAAKVEKEADTLAGLTRLAELQVQMEDTQAQAQAKKPKAVKLRPVPKGHRAPTSQSEEPFSKAGRHYAFGNMDIPGPGEAPSLKDQIFNEDEFLGGDVDIPDGTKQKPKKPSLKAAISSVRDNIDADNLINDACANNVNEKGNSLLCVFSLTPDMFMLTESTLYFLNFTWTSRMKNSLGGCIQNWRTHVHKSTSASSQQASVTTATQPPPSTIFSSSEVSKRTSVSSHAPHPPTSKANDPEDLIGAFGDEDLDDTLEQEAAAFMTKSQGKQPSTISISSTSDSDSDLEPPPCTQPGLKNCNMMPPPSTQPGLKNHHLMLPPSMQPRVVSSTKRKQPAEVIEFSESEISEFPNTDDDLMEIDGANNDLDTYIKPEPDHNIKVARTTVSAPVPPSKKVKLERNVKLEGNIKSEGASAVPPGTWVEPVSKAHSSYLNTDLPPGCHEGGKWARDFLPMVFLWLSTQEELWVIANIKLLMACKEIFKVVYPDIRYNVSVSGSVFGVVTQRVSEWCSTFGSTVLAIVIDFCASNQDSTPTELADLLLAHYAFLYPNPDIIDKKETFRSAFVQELLATVHLSRIMGHADVPVLNTDGLIKHGFVGALGLCAVSLKRAFTLLTDNTVTINHKENLGLLITAWRAHLKTSKTFNKTTGKETVSEHSFSIAKWKAKTDAFTRGATKKGVAAMELTVSMAWKLLKKPGFEKYTSNDSSEDDHADIWYVVVSFTIPEF
ncbi:hypothetical protein BDR05DRAFT_996814 [Suillus weaverae]|nr:hypothetical protein BDR05DRAFT_996814 [Suillus weaverae]